MSQAHRLWRGLAREVFSVCRDCDARADCLDRGWLPLHGLGQERGAWLLRGLAGERACFLLAEYALAERNLHFPAAWLRAGLENIAWTGHGAQYRDFMRAGGLEGALRRAGVFALERRSLGLGLLALVRCAGNQAGRH